MPRMSKKLKKELAFFLNDRGRRSNGILFIRFPVMEIAAALSRSPQTCKRSLNELEQAGMIMRVRQGIGEVSHMYILLPKEDTAHE